AIGARLRPEFLSAAAGGFGDIQVSVRIDGELMRIPNRSRERALRAPRRDHLSAEVELHDLVVIAADGRKIPIGGDHDVLRLAHTSKLIEIFSVLVEDLDAPVPSIGNVNTAISIDVDRMHGIELTISLAGSAPLENELPILVELHHSRVRVAVADEERSVRQPCNVCGTAEVFFVSARDAWLSKRHYETLAVMCELEDLLAHVVDNPDVAFGIVRTDFHFVRTASAFEQVIPLRP